MKLLYLEYYLALEVESMKQRGNQFLYEDDIKMIHSYIYDNNNGWMVLIPIMDGLKKDLYQ